MERLFFNIKSGYVMNNHITYALNELTKSEFDELKSSDSILIIYKKKYEDGNIRNISYMQNIFIKDIEILKDIFIEFLQLTDEEYYKDRLVKNIIFTYKILNKDYKISESKILRHKKITTKNKISNTKIKSYNLPNTMDITKWGKVLYEENVFNSNIDEKKWVIKKSDSLIEYHITQKVDNHSVNLILNGRKIISFIDKKSSENNLSSFTRTLNNYKYYYINEKLVLKEVERKVQYLKSINRDILINEKFITMDIETRSLNNILTPLSVSIFDGTEVYSFYLNDYNNDYDKLIKESIKLLMQSKYDKYVVYLHNFSKFDGVFILRFLAEMGVSVKPIKRDDNFIDIIFKFKSLSLIYLYI